MAKNFLKLNLQVEPELNKKKKKKTIVWVFTSHIIFLFTIFAVFTFKGCSHKPRENVIQVTLAAPQQSEQQISRDVQSQPKKTQKQPEKKVNKKIVKKVPVKKPVKKWKALDPNEILKSSKTITKQKPVPVKKYTPIKADQIANNLRKGVKTIKFNNSFNANSSILSYYDEISQYLYSRWQQPSRSVLGNKIPVVNVKITVDAYGNIKNYSITSLSGISAMDASIKSLLQNLSNLPKPPDGAMTIDVSLELEN
jgi:TonB family protein